MSLKINESSSSPNSNSLGQNCYYNLGTITKVTDTSDTAENKYEKDVAIQLEMTVEGLEYPKTVTISGDFKKDVSGVIVGWGGAFKVEKLFTAAGIKGESIVKPNGKTGFASEIVNQLLGKQVAHLSFKKVDGKYKVWDQIFNPEVTPQVLKNLFTKDRDRITKGGYDAGKSWKWDRGEVDGLPNAVPNGIGDPHQQPMNGTDENLPDFMQ